MDIDRCQRITSSRLNDWGILAPGIMSIQMESLLRTPVLLLSLLSLVSLLSPTAHAADPGQQTRAGTPFGTLRSPGQAGIRPESLRRPSSTLCPTQSQADNDIASTRRDPSGRIHVFGDMATQQNRNGNIYSCTGVPGSGKKRAYAGTGRAKSAYNARTNTLNAATDGYVNRSATSSMMPRKAPSMYDPATGVLKPSRKLNAYEIYQR